MKFLSVALLLAGAAPACAGTPLTIFLDRTQLLTLNSDPGTVVIGNPAIADVALNGRQVYISGHSYGETNLSIFDSQGSKIADFDLSVGHANANEVTVFVGSGTGAVRRTMTCAPNCEAAIMPGDDNGWFSTASSQAQVKAQAALGVANTAPASMPAGNAGAGASQGTAPAPAGGTTKAAP